MDLLGAGIAGGSHEKGSGASSKEDRFSQQRIKASGAKLSEEGETFLPIFKFRLLCFDARKFLCHVCA